MPTPPIAVAFICHRASTKVALCKATKQKSASLTVSSTIPLIQAKKGQQSWCKPRLHKTRF